MEESNGKMKGFATKLLITLLTMHLFTVEAVMFINRSPDPIIRNLMSSPGKTGFSEIMKLPTTESANNSISLISKSRPGKLTSPIPSEKLGRSELNPQQEISEMKLNETYISDENDIDEFRYLTRDKRDWDAVNDSFFNDSLANDTFSEEEFLDSLWEMIYPKSWTWILIIFHSIVFVVGIIGNILVCVAVYRNHTMRTVTNYFIVNLAIADFLVILFCLPPSVVWDVTVTWFFGIAMCKIVLYIQSVSVTVSVLTLTFISIDRWYAICFPLKFKSTTGRAKTAIAIIWILALACDIPEMIYVTTIPKVVEVETVLFTQCSPTWSLEMETIFVILKMILFYLIPLMFMSVAYLQIIRVLWKSGHVPQRMLDGSRQNTFAMNMNTSTEGQLRSRRKAAKMLVAVVAMFAFCYFPVHLLSIRRTVGLKNTDGNRAFSLISHWLCYANSAVNPIIYNFMSGKFRKEFHRAFEHCCQRTGGHGFQFNAVYRKTEKDSGIASRTQSRTELDKHNRRGTRTSRTSVLQVET